MDIPPKPELKIISPGFERSLNGVLDLYMVAGIEGLSMAVANPTARRFIAFEQWNINPDQHSIQNVLAQSELLNATENFRRVVCGIHNDQCVFIPEPLFDAQTLEEQLELCFGPMPATSKCGHDRLPMLGVVNCHYYNQAVHDTLANRFSQLQFHHTSSMRLLYMASVSGPGKDALVMVEVDGSSIQITVVKGAALMFHNRFEFHTPEELTYYLLLVFEQLKLGPETTNVFFTGKIDKDQTSFSLAAKYIAHCRISGLPSAFTYEPEFSFLEGCRHFNLFCGPLCVS